MQQTTDRTGYPILVGAHVVAPDMPSKQTARGCVEGVDPDIITVRSPIGMRFFRPSEVEVVRVSDKRANRLKWVKRLEYDQLAVPKAKSRKRRRRA